MRENLRATVSEALERKVESECKARGLSKSQLVEKAVEAYLAPPKAPQVIVAHIVPPELDAALEDFLQYGLRLKGKQLEETLGWIAKANAVKALAKKL